MLTTTWELHFAAPRSPEQGARVSGGLASVKRQYTEMRFDWFEDGDTLSVMVGDIEVFLQVLRRWDLKDLVLQKVTCGFVDSTYDGAAHGTMVLDDEEDEHSEISFPTEERSE